MGCCISIAIHGFFGWYFGLVLWMVQGCGASLLLCGRRGGNLRQDLVCGADLCPAIRQEDQFLAAAKQDVPFVFLVTEME